MSPCVQRLSRLAELLDRRGRVRLSATAWQAVVVERYDRDVLYRNQLFHHLYRGDGVLHLIAAAHRAEFVDQVVGLGVPVDGCWNRRSATALHYAADGVVDHAAYDARAQGEVVRKLLQHGADVDARDKGGATPVMRAIRCRAWAAVEALIAGGADWRIANAQGTSALDMATLATGRGGSGSRVAKDNQVRIVELLRSLT